MNFNYDLGKIDTILTIDTTNAPALGGQTNVLVVAGSGAIALPLGNTAARPATPAPGHVRFNNTAGNGFLEYYDNSPGWQQLSATTGTVSSIIVTTGTGMSVSGGSTQTITSNGTFAMTLSSALTALSTLGAAAGTGLIVQTGVNTFADVSIAGTAGNITVSNGSGVAGNPTINLASVAQGSTGTSFVKVGLDGFGRVTTNTAVVQADLTGLLGNYYLPGAGGTMTGAINMGTNQINNLGMAATPAQTDAVNVAYVQAALNGLSWKQEVQAATTANIVLTGLLTIDGYQTVAGDRILVKNQTTSSANGIYAAAAGAWTRTADASTGTQLDGAAVYVTQGTTLVDTGWVQTDASIVIGTSPVTWSQFSGSNTYTAGTGIALIGNAFSNTGVLSFQTNLSGLTPSTSSTGAVTLSGTLGTGSGGTGATATPANGQMLVGNGTGFTVATIGTGTGISTTIGSGTLQINNTGVTSITGTANQITASASTGGVTLSLPSSVSIANLTLTGLTANTMLYVGAGSALTSTGAATNGQILIGSTGLAPALGTITAGTAISVTNGAGSITINNTGVTSNVAGTGISVSGATGAVTITNTGVTSWSAGTTGLTPNSATTGAVTLGGTLAVANGGTGLSSTPANGALDIGNGVGFTRTTLTAGTGISVVNAAGSITLNNTGVTSVALVGPAIFTVSGSPVTTTGTLTVALTTQTANTVFAAPNGSTGTPSFRALVTADLPLKLYVENPSSPSASTATGANAIALGSGAVANMAGGVVQSAGIFGAAGDAQHATYVLRNSTANATQTELFLDGTSAEYVVSASNVVAFEVMVAAINTASTGAGAGFKIQGVVYRGATLASVAFIGVPSQTILGRTPNGLNATVAVNTTTGALQVLVTGIAASNYHWVATLETTEVGAA